MDTIGTTKHISAPSVQISIQINSLQNKIKSRVKYYDDNGYCQQHGTRVYDPEWKEKMEAEIATLEKEYLLAIKIIILLYIIMLSEYWWIIVLIILLLMIFYPKQKMHKNKQINKKKLSINFNPILKNINSLTQYYIKNN